MICRFRAYAIFAGASLAVTGCLGTGNDPTLQPVAGIVLLDGRPLDSGTMLFVQARPPILGSPALARGVIKNGRFAISRDKGLIKGKHRIMIWSRRTPADPKSESEAAVAAPMELIPLKFNQETELEVEVKEGGIKELRIAITSK
jgi:hypothetical protein